MRKLPVRILLVILLLSVWPIRASDPLPSWSDSSPKKAILELVTKVTDSRSPGFVPVGERIATFDNDGTLWSEQPYYFQGYFYLARIETLAPGHPEWQTREPFASLIKGDFTAFAQGGNPAMAAVFTAAHAGFTPGQFQESAEAWIEEARHPQTGLLFTQMVYQPMLEVISYLQSKGFKVYIVSGGDLDFMRPWTDKVYHIPPEQVIGTGGALTRLPERESILRKLADCNACGTMLYPKPGVMRLAFDESYIMASLGVLAKTDPVHATMLLKQSLRFV